MKDSFFSTKKYRGTYTPIYAFKTYGDTSNYFIALEYVCNRDDYQSLRNPKGTALNFDMENVNGEKIFGDVPADHIAILQSREYTLEASAEPESLTEDDRLVSITEIYVYEPSDEFVAYNSTIVPIWGLKDDTESATTSVVTGSSAGNVYRNSSGNSIVKLASVTGLQTGDYITFYFVGRWSYYFVATGGYGYVTNDCSFSPTASYKILAIDGKYVEVDGVVLPGDCPTLDDMSSSTSAISKLNQSTSDTKYFFNGLNGEGAAADVAGMWAVSCTVEKEYAYRAFQRRLATIKETLTMHKEIPDVPDRFAPSDETGTEFTEISRWTTTTPAQWCSKVEAEAWFIYTEPELTYNSTTGLYELLSKTTRCI